MNLFLRSKLSPGETVGATVNVLPLLAGINRMGGLTVCDAKTRYAELTRSLNVSFC
jgi:hypothetical protein